MSFELDFEEVPLIISGVPISPVSGRAEFTDGGDVEEISIENPWDTSGRRLYLTDKTTDGFRRVLFELLAASIKVTCIGRIHEAMATVRSDKIASLHDWKRKNAAEMA